MAGVNDRRSRPTLPYDSQKLARISEERGAAAAAAPGAPADEDDEALKEWDSELVESQRAGQPAALARVILQRTPPAGVRRASGTTPPEETPRLAVGTTPPAGPAPPGPAEIRSRTSTVHDPLTTSVLAEVARRARTLELPPRQVPTDADDGDAEEHDDATDRLRPTKRP